MISVRALNKQYITTKRQIKALDNVNMDIQGGQFVSIVGASGCGKSTLLKIVGGLESPTSGFINVNGAVNPRPASDRGMLFQSYTLYPWLTVQKNIEFGPRLKKMSGKDVHEISRDLIEKVKLQGFEDLYPSSLSGGMQQRVALARMLANNPEILLMDEPFGALDAQTRTSMQRLLINLWEKDNKTVLFVTHDIDEAILLSDVIYVMSSHPGKVKERIEVPIARPRTFACYMEDDFRNIKQQISDLLYEENEKNMRIIS